MKLKVGGLYMNPEHFVSEANKIVAGEGNLVEHLLARRSTTSKVTAAGKEIIEKVKKHFLGLGYKVAVKWDQYCGCSMCPCSPGFSIYLELRDGAPFKRYFRAPKTYRYAPSCKKPYAVYPEHLSIYVKEGTNEISFQVNDCEHLLKSARSYSVIPEVSEVANTFNIQAEPFYPYL